MVADLNFAYLFPFRGDKAETKQLRFYFKHSSKRGVSFIYLFQQKNYLCNNSEFFLSQQLLSSASLEADLKKPIA